MSQTVHYKGTLRKVFEGEGLEEHCKKLLGDKPLPSYYKNYQEYLLDQNYGKMTIQNGVLYQVQKEYVDPNFDIYSAKVEGDGEISFEVRYYNEGCSFNEAIGQALKNIPK